MHAGLVGKMDELDSCLAEIESAMQMVPGDIDSTRTSFQNDNSRTLSQRDMEILILRSDLDRLIESNAKSEKNLSAKSSEIDELKNRLSETNTASARLIAEKSKEIEDLKNRLSESCSVNASILAEINVLEKRFASHISTETISVKEQRGMNDRLRQVPNSIEDSVDARSSEFGSFNVEADAWGGQKDLADEVRSQIKKFFAAKDDRFWKKAFERHVKGHDKMSKQNFRLALHDLGIFLDEEGEREVFDSADADEDQGLDFNEFLMAVRKPSKVEQWTAGLTLTKLFAAAFVPIIRQSKLKEDPLIALSECSPQILSSVVSALKDGLNELLWKHISELKTGYRALKTMNLETQGPQTLSKFSIGEVGTMSCGKINDFYGGLGSRVGQ